MWFLKKSLLGLALVVGAVCSSFAGEPSYDIDVYPFQFNAKANGQSQADWEKQQLEKWNRLMKYKLFATGLSDGRGIKFTGQSIFITDSVGYVGSATGNFELSEEKHSVGGPILFGGSFSNGNGSDSLLTGPVRFTKKFVPKENGYQSNYFSGKICFDGGYQETSQNANDLTTKGVSNGGGEILDAGRCALSSEVPFVDDDLAVPEFGIDWPTNLSSLKTDVNNRTMYIHVPAYDQDSSAYTVFLDKITFAGDANSELHVVMPPGGRLTKVYVKNGIQFSATKGNIKVVYANKGSWNNGKWEGFEDVPLSNLEYAGNLLFYTPGRFTVATVERELQGTYISGEEIHIEQNMSFAGQLIANYIEISHNFKAKEFRYVPFNPPQIGLNMAANQLISEADAKDGSYAGTSLNVSLTKNPDTDVKFNYCFRFFASSADAGTSNANYNDVCNESANVDGSTCKGYIELPLCELGQKAPAIIEKNTLTPKTDIKIWVRDDNTIENREFFQLVVTDLVGGVFSDNSREWAVSMQILDDDKTTPCNIVGDNNSVTIEEDAVVVLDGFFPARCFDDTWTAYDVIIESVPDKGSLKLNGRDVVKGDTIASGNLRNLKFTPDANQSGTPSTYRYTEIGFKIYDRAQPRITDDTYTLTINVTPVNDAPTATKIGCDNVSIPENSSVGTPVCTVSGSDVDASTKKSGEYWTLQYEIVYGNVGEVFTISSTGEISVNKNTINFEALKNPVYPLVVRVRDGSPNDFVDVPVNVTITDVNEKPTVKGCTGTVAENSPVNTPTGCWVDAVDPDKGDVLTYTITSGNTNSIFGIDNAGNIYVKKAAIDYDTMGSNKYYTLKVKVSDGHSGHDITVTARIDVTDINERPSFPDVECSIKENSTTFEEGDDCKIASVDPEGRELLFTIENGNVMDGSTPIFAINSTTGIITANKAPDYEKFTGTILYISIKDQDKSGNLENTVYAKATITVINVNEPPTAAVADTTIDENSDVNTYVTWVEASDIEDGYKLTYEIVGGNDDGAFKIVSSGQGNSDDGNILVARGDIDYETLPAGAKFYTLSVKVCDLGTPGAAINKLCVTKTVKINIRNGNERPSITGVPDTTIDEHTPVGTVVGTVTGTDPEDQNNDNGTLTYHFNGGNDGQVFAIDSVTGVITVAKDIDYETLVEFRADTVFKIKVFAKDAEGLRSTETIVTIAIRDINEGPKVDDVTMTVPENKPVGTVVDTLELFDPDKKPEFLQNKFEAVGGDTAFFSIDSITGVIKTKAVFDYEAKDTYTLEVVVKDQDGHTDKATVTIKIGDVKETSEIVVTRAETGSHTREWIYPTETIYTNENNMYLYWTADDIPMDSLLTDLHEGYNVVTLTYTDPTKNKGVTKTVGIYVSTRAPEVTVSTSANHNSNANIYTLVEQPAEGDSSVYVNKKNNDIVITIKDPVFDKSYTDSTCNYDTHTFTVNTELNPVIVPSSAYSTMDKIVAAGPVLNTKPNSEVSYSQYNKDQVKVSYKEKVAGVDVEVSYVTDKAGNVVKQAVIGANGKIDSIEVITVSYKVNAGGKMVNVSYVADAATGQPLKTTTVTGSGSGSTPVSMYSLTEGEVQYSVTYDFKTKVQGLGETTVQVSYTVNQKGNVTKDKDGNVGYAVSYTYVNEMGNSSTQSVYIVVDLIPPKVKIESPKNDDVLHSNMVEVKWCVDLGDGLGCQPMDSLNFEGLQPGGVNEIVRLFRDKAGNEASDRVFVMAKNTKDVDISVEKPVTIITKEAVEQYYASKKPEPGQTFSISVYNPQAKKEVETMVGGKFKNKEVAHDSVYPGLSGHLGPTLGIQAKVPVINSVDGLATLDDLVGSDGMVLLDAVDAVNSKRVTVEEFVDQYCDSDFKAEVGGDISRSNLYDTKMTAKIWVYTSLGQFVDYFKFTQELNDPDYASDAGVLNMYFEMKPDENGDLHTENGRLYATGAYVYKTEITMKSKLRCDLPPFNDVTNVNKRSRPPKKVRENLLKSFGYKRPSNK